MITGARLTRDRSDMPAGRNGTTGHTQALGTADRLDGPWQSSVRESVLSAVSEFLDSRCAQSLPGSRVDIAENVLRSLLADGKCLRSTFLYLGWLSGAHPESAAIRAAASLEFLHAFALMQDDVMDGSPMRRGRASAHRAFEDWHHRRRLPGSSARFGESAAILLGDLCLVWAEQMLRESGLADDVLARAWPRYDAMRTELAVGQFADLVNDTSVFPSLDDVLDVARRKSGNYTVRRPLEIGAALSGCDEPTVSALGDYGVAVGEAFQLRDDLLGVFGQPETTGKPSGSDLAARKATTVVVAAYQLGSSSQRRHLEQLMTSTDLRDDDITRWQCLIAEIGTVEWMEQLIDRRLAWALHRLDSVSLDGGVRSALASMAAACTERVA